MVTEVLMKVVIVAGVYSTPNVNTGLLRLQSVDFGFNFLFCFAQLSLFKKKIQLFLAKSKRYAAFSDYQLY